MMFLWCRCVLVVLTVVTLFASGDEISEKYGDRKDVAAGRGLTEEFGIDQWKAVQPLALDSSGWIASEANPDDQQPRRRLRKRKRRPQANPEIASEVETHHARPRRRRPIRLDEARDTWKELEDETPKRTYHRRRVGPIYLPDGPASATISFGEEESRRNDDQRRNEENYRRNGDERRRNEEDSRRNEEEPRRSGDERRRNEEEPRRNGDERRRNEEEPRRNGDERKRNEEDARRNEQSRRNEARRKQVEDEENPIDAQIKNNNGRKVMVGRRKRLRTTTTSTTTIPPATVVDIKNLIKQNGGMSLSEILQKKNLSLSDLLKGKEQAISALSAQSSQQNLETKLFENEKTDVELNRGVTKLSNEDNYKDISKKHGSDKTQIVADYEDIIVDWRKNKDDSENDRKESSNSKRTEEVSKGFTDSPRNVGGKQDLETESKSEIAVDSSKSKNDAPLKVMLDWGYFTEQEHTKEKQINPEEDDAEKYLLMNDESRPALPKWKQTDLRRLIEHRYSKRPTENSYVKQHNMKDKDSRPSEDEHIVIPMQKAQNIEEVYTKHDSKQNEDGSIKEKSTERYSRPLQNVHKKSEGVDNKQGSRRPHDTLRPIDDGYIKQDSKIPSEDIYPKYNTRKPIESIYIKPDLRIPTEYGYPPKIRQDSNRPIDEEFIKQGPILSTEYGYPVLPKLKHDLRRPAQQPAKVVLNWGQTASGDLIGKYVANGFLKTTEKPVMDWGEFIETDLSSKIIPEHKDPTKPVWGDQERRHMMKNNQNVKIQSKQEQEDSLTEKNYDSIPDKIIDSIIKNNNKDQFKIIDSTAKYAKDHITYQPKQSEKVFDSLNEADVDKDVLEAHRKRLGSLFKNNGHKIFSEATTEPTDKRIFVPSHPKYYTSLNYKPDFNIDSILKTTTVETPTSTEQKSKPKLPITSAKIMKGSKVKMSTLPPKAIKISLSELLANKENEGPLKMLFDLEEFVSNTVIPPEHTSTLPPEFESTTMMQEKVHAVSAKDEIMEILRDENTKLSLEKILERRNMTVDELVEQRERGSSQRHLADIFHNKTKEPEPIMEHVAEIKVMRKGKLIQHEVAPTEIKIKEIPEIRIPMKIREFPLHKEQEISDVSISSEELITSERIPGTSFPTYKIENKHKQNPIPIWKTIYNTKEKPVPIIEEIENTISEAINEELTKDKNPSNDYDEYVQLPLGVKSAIFASLAIIAISIVVFLTILIIFKWAQQQKQRLCYPGTFKSPILQSESKKSIRTFVSETLGRKKNAYTSRLQSMSDSWDGNKPYQ